MENIVCTVNGKPLEYLEYANSLHKSLQISLNKLNSNGKQAFLDLDINVNDDRKISCHLYQKPTEAGIIIKFLIWAPLHHNKNVIQESVHGSFNATFDWQSFDVALRKTQKIWSKNQFSTEWSSSIVDEKLDKKVTKESYSKIAFKRTTYQNYSNFSTEMSSNRCFLFEKRTFAKRP